MESWRASHITLTRGLRPPYERNAMSRYRRDHTPGGTFFFTLNLQDRHSSLLTERITAFQSSYRRVKAELPFITLAICVLPDHLHAVWRLPEHDADFSTRWQKIKAGFSQSILNPGVRSKSQVRKGEKGLWQRRFWEHRIRDAEDLQRHVDYVHYNPVKHGLVQHAASWQHSSFHDFVRRGLLPLSWAGNRQCIEVSRSGE